MKPSWKRVNKSNRCVICDKASWCTFTDNAVKCMRACEPNGTMRFVKQTADGGYLFKDEADETNKVQGRSS